MRALLAVAIMLLGSVILAPSWAFAARPFVNEIVDPVGPNGECNYLAVDAWGRPHVAYNDGGTNELKYAVKIGGRWRIETVPGTAGLMGDEVAIDVDSKGQPHIIWWNDPTDDVDYAAKIDGKWVLETVATTGSLGRNLAVAVDAQDRVHAVFSEEAPNKLWYALRDGSWGTPEAIDASLGSAGGYCGVTTDAEGRPHVAYQGTIPGGTGLRYAVRNPTWSSVVADPTLNGANICSIALDPMGRPHLSSYVSSSSDLRHAYLQDGAWQSELVDGATTQTGAENSIAVDAQGGIHISYFEPGTAQNLRYAFNDGSGWVKQTVDETGLVGCYTNIALDSEGNPHIIHYDNTNQVLKYATSAVRIVSPFGGEVWAGGAEHEVIWEGPGPVNIELSSDGGFTYETIASGVQRQRVPVTIPRVATTAARIRIVRATPFSSSSSPSPFSIAPDLVAPWWNALVDSVGQTGSGCVLALDAHDNPRIVFNGATGLRYAARSGDRWYFDTITSSGGNASFKLQNDGTPHVSYYLGSSKDLYYATRSPTGGWTTQAIETTNDVGLNSSLAVSRDSIEVAFYDNTITNKDLRFATKVIGGSTWRSALVDGGSANAGLNPSLALSRDAVPHIVYRDATNQQLKHAWRTPSGWVNESVYVGGPGTGQSASLAIDERGALHASFMVASGESLFYAVREDESWRIELIDAGIVGSGVGQTSIAIDGDGRPHVSYMMDGYELRHAVRLNGGWVIEEVSEPPPDPAVGAAYDGQNNSLAIDSQGAARIAYLRYSLIFEPSFIIDFDLRYASSAIELLSPAHAASWPVGARRQITWDGTGPVDVFLSTDGGFSYNQIADDVRGGEYRLTVPANTSTQCKVMVERAIPHSVSVSDSFFTVQSQVALVAFSAAAPTDGSTGVELTWSTDPGLPDLSGYRIDRRRENGEWQNLASSLQSSSWIDHGGRLGSSYRLTAINGLGEEIELGETAFGRLVPLAAWPVPLREGSLSISFATYGGLGGGTGDALVEIYDLGGRLVRTVARGAFEAGLQQVNWDGTNTQGTRVAPGMYFVRAQSAGQFRTLKVVVSR